MRSLARWGTLPLLMAPLGSWALGLGDIEAHSYLNQPFNAEIPLSATPDELKGLRVSLAPVSEFTRQQIPYPAFLSSIALKVAQDASGSNIIQITTPRSISDPVVTLLIQLSGYGRGTITREYTVFLDPPTFLPAEAAPEPVAPPAARAPSNSGGVIQRPAPAPAPAPTRAPAPTQAPAPVQSPAAPAPAVSQTQAAPDGTDYTVAAGDTLWRIAERYRPQGVSTNQAMMSIFDGNPAAFDGNINRLRRGAILRIPPAASFDNMSAADATAEVRRQNSEWQASGTASPRLVLRPPGEEAGAGNAAAAGASSSARVSELEGQVSDLEANLSQTQSDLDDAKRLLELRDNQLAELQQQIADANASAEAAPAAPPGATETDAATEAAPAAGEAETPAEEAPVFADDQTAAEAPTATEAPESETAANARALAATPPAAPAPRPAAEPSRVDRIMGFVTGLAKPLYLAIAGVFVILIGALAFLRRRREDSEDVTGQWEALEAELDDETDHAATARIRARHEESDMLVVEGHDGDETAEEPNLGGTAEIEALDVDDVLGGDAGGVPDLDAGTAEIDALVMPESEALEEPEAPEPEPAEQTLSSQTVINLDQADPIAEADFHMAYGLYDQAADLINKALGEDSGNKALKLKLLEVYFVWGNKESFLDSARAYRADLGTADWDKVVIMGKQICPDESLFAEATAAAGEVDLDLEASGSSAGLDFSFDSGEDEGDALDLSLEDSGEIDNGGLSLEAGGARAAAASEDEMLDIGARTQAGLEAALLEEDETDEAGARTTPGDVIGDLDATMESPTVETAYAGSSDDFGLTLESPTVEAEGPDSPTVETPTVEAPAPSTLEGGDTVEQPRPDSGSATTEMTAEIELDDLGLDVGDIDELTGVSPPDDEDELLSATGVTQVLHQEESDIEFTGTAVLGDEDATMMAPGFDSESTGIRTEVLEQSAANFEPEPPETEDDLDLNLDDFSSALSGADTVEQPVPSRFSGLDLDIGGAVDLDDDAPTGTEEMPLDPQTMTEVGTKLDLARAYIDMGDPDGAKSILEEVLTEGDAGQRSEAQALIDALPAA